MAASLHTHTQQFDADGHRPYRHVTVTVPAGDPRRRQPTTRVQRVYTGRAVRVEEAPSLAAGRHRAAKAPVVRVPFDAYRRRAVYTRQRGHLGDFTARQRRRINKASGRALLRAMSAETAGA